MSVTVNVNDSSVFRPYNTLQHVLSPVLDAVRTSRSSCDNLIGCQAAVFKLAVLVYNTLNGVPL